MESDSGEIRSGRSSGKRPTLAGVEVREEDLIRMPGLNFVSMVFRVSAAVILGLAVWQFADWWTDRPPGNVGMAVLVGDTIRLIVVAALLWAASNLAGLLIRSHYDLRASRILLSRQTYVLRLMAIHSGAITPPDTTTGVHTAERRGVATDETPTDGVPPGEETLG